MRSLLNHIVLEIVCIFIATVIIPLAAHVPEEPVALIALGDSVPAGFGVAENERYTALFADMLMQGGYINRYINFAKDGFTTTTLLSQLNNLDEYDISLFQDAYVITLNIGGNNILTPLINYLPAPEDVVDMVFELWDFIQASMLIVPEVMGIASDFQEALDGFSLWRVWELPALNRMVQDASPVLGEVAEMFERVNELQFVRMLPMLEGEFSPELDAALQGGVATFEAEFNQIIEWIQAHAPDAIIIVNTVYNPVPDNLFGMTLEGLSGRANVLIQAINRIILGAAANGYIVADVYAAFAGEAYVMNFSVDAAALTLSFDVIHPNAVGHELIAGMKFDMYVWNADGR